MSASTIFLQDEKRSDNGVTSIKVCLGSHGKAGMNRCMKFSDRRAPQVNGANFQHRIFTHYEGIQGTHSQLLRKLLKLTEINELYFSRNRIRPLQLAFTELLCLKSLCGHMFCILKANSPRSHVSNEHSCPQGLCCNQFAMIALLRGSFHPFSECHYKASTAGTLHIPPGGKQEEHDVLQRKRFFRGLFRLQEMQYEGFQGESKAVRVTSACRTTWDESCKATLKAVHMAPVKSVPDLAMQSLKLTLSATRTGVTSSGFTSSCNKIKRIWGQNTTLPLAKTKPRNQKYYKKQLICLNFVFILTLISEMHRLLYPALILGVSTVFYITTMKKCL